MKKFLCYDTNDAASGKINVDSRGMLKPNSTVPSTNGSAYQQLVTDSDGNTKWEDRLAYVTTEEQVIFSKENIAFAERNGLYMSSGFPITAINVGDKLRVDFDGDTYVLTAFAPMPGAPLIAIGNGALHHMGDDTGEPFLIQYDIEENDFLIATALTSPAHTVSIYRHVETTHKIPQVYLPEIASETEEGLCPSMNGLGAFVIDTVFDRFHHASNMQTNYYEDVANVLTKAMENIPYGVSSSSYNVGGKVLTGYYNYPEKYVTVVLSGDDSILCVKYSDAEAPKKLWKLGPDGLILSSSTSGSTKQFRINVDDTGTISATEVTT